MEDKAEVPGYITLFIGVALLAFTFASAYLFLSSSITIAGSSDLVTVFGVALGPLIETCIRIMYLGVMGWIGSLLTIRGVQLVTQLKREAKPEIKPQVMPITPEPAKAPEPKTMGTMEAEKTGKIRKAKLVESSS
jgi:hypothetical protein